MPSSITAREDSLSKDMSDLPGPWLSARFFNFTNSCMQEYSGLEWHLYVRKMLAKMS